MEHEIHITVTLENAEYEALIADAARYQIATPQEWLEAILYREIAIIADEYDPVLSDEEFREFEHRYGEEDWTELIDPEIPF